MEQEAERLYNALLETFKETGMVALMTAGGDLKNRTEFAKANPKTRDIFYKLAANLTARAPKA